MLTTCPKCHREVELLDMIVTVHLGVVCRSCAAPELSERAAADELLRALWREPVMTEVY